jgi:hypothetical protein
MGKSVSFDTLQESFYRNGSERLKRGEHVVTPSRVESAPASRHLSDLAIVTAGLAKEVDAVNQ